jgi:hypothetical protein
MLNIFKIYKTKIPGACRLAAERAVQKNVQSKNVKTQTDTPPGLSWLAKLVELDYYM